MRLLGALRWLLRTVVPGAARGFVSEVLSKAERYLLPYVMAALGVAVQMRWIKLRELPALCIKLVLNPSDLLATAVKPALRAALTRLREAARLPSAVMAFLKP